MPIKLNGSSSGFTQIDAASVAGNNTLTLPTASGTLMTTGGTNTFTANQVIEVTDNTNAALRITQLGTGNALLVEDSTNPDSSPFVVDASGNVGVGTTSPAAKFVIEGGTSSDQMRMGTGSNYYQIGRESVSTGFLNFYGTQTGANGYVFGGVDGERMRIDSSGNVGIGVTPSTRLDVSGNIRTNSQIQVNGGGGNGITMYDDVANSFISYGYSGTRTNAAGHRWYNGLTTEVMRIDTSGNVGIGAAPNARFDVTGADDTQVIFRNTSAVFRVRPFVTGLNYTQLSALNPAGNAYAPLAVGGSITTLETNGVERMRITSGGFVYIGSSSQIGTDGTLQVRGISGSSFAAAFDNGSASAAPAAFNRTDDGAVMRFYRAWAGGGVGNISVTSTATAYNTSSDYRLKESIQPVSDPVLRVLALRPVNFAWKIDGSRVDGFIAHEAAEVVPEAVTGSKDAVDDDGSPVYQSIDQSKLVPLLTAALQEALTKIDALEARIAALENV